MALLIPMNSRVDWPLATRGVSKTGPEPRTKKQIHMSLVYVSPMKQNNICNGGICLYIYLYICNTPICYQQLSYHYYIIYHLKIK